MNVRDLIKKHEGLRFAPYKCGGGYWTIGFGHNLEARNEPIPDSITLQEAEIWLDRDLADATSACERVIASWSILGEVRQAVLVDMCFNLGEEGLLKFKRMLRAIDSGYYAHAAAEMLDSRYATQVGQRAKDNALMLSTGQWI